MIGRGGSSKVMSKLKDKAYLYLHVTVTLCHGVMKNFMSSTIGVPSSRPEEATIRCKVCEPGGSRCPDS